MPRHTPEERRRRKEAKALADAGVPQNDFFAESDELERKREANETRLRRRGLQGAEARRVISERVAARADDRRRDFLPGDPRGSAIKPRTVDEIEAEQAVTANRQQLLPPASPGGLHRATADFDSSVLPVGTQFINSSGQMVRVGADGREIPLKIDKTGELVVDEAATEAGQDIEQISADLAHDLTVMPGKDLAGASNAVRTAIGNLRDSFKKLLDNRGDLDDATQRQLLTQARKKLDVLRSQVPDKEPSITENIFEGKGDPRLDAITSNPNFESFVMESEGGKATFKKPEQTTETGRFVGDDGFERQVSRGDRVAEGGIERRVKDINPNTGAITFDEIETPDEAKPPAEGTPEFFLQFPLNEAGQAASDTRDFDSVIEEERARMESVLTGGTKQQKKAMKKTVAAIPGAAFVDGTLNFASVSFENLEGVLDRSAKRRLARRTRMFVRSGGKLEDLAGGRRAEIHHALPSPPVPSEARSPAAVTLDATEEEMQDFRDARPGASDEEIVDVARQAGAVR